MCFQRLHVADAAVDHEPLQSACLRPRREHLSPISPHADITDIDDQHGTAASSRDRHVYREVVAGETPDGDRPCCETSTPGMRL